MNGSGRINDLATGSDETAGAGSRRRAEIYWLDAVKAVALLWIVFNHSVEQLVGSAFLGDPSAAWPALGERVAQLFAPAGFGLGPFWTFARDVAWIGDEGVGVFLIVSGLGLAWSLQRIGAAFDAGGFLRRRLARIFPTWWTAHLGIGLPALVLGNVSLPVLVLSALGIRFLPKTMYAIVPAWWYIGLLLQLYAVFPLLWLAQRRFGITRTFAAAAFIGFAGRALALFASGSAMGDLCRGSIFVTRLPEFAFGVALAVWCSGDPGRLTRLVRSRSIVIVAAVAFLAGNAAALTFAGEIVAPLLTSAGAFALIAAAVAYVRWPALRWAGKHSLSLYLVHQAAIDALVPMRAASLRGLIGLALALIVTPLLAVALERATGVLERTTYRPSGLPRIAAAAAVVFVLLCIGEWSVRRFDPQEALGWGERPSLVADAAVGWKMRPSSTTHLRWESYDYVVSANALGFPAPDPPGSRPPGSKLMMTVGNAFTSAEGVDTDRAWPRLLEHDDPTLHVANFAITGHGPNQYAEVVRTYGPALRPDIVFVGMYVKDFHDSLVDERIFQNSIGFGELSPDSPQAFFRFAQLYEYFHLRILRPLQAALARAPNPEGYFLGSFEYFDPRHAVTPREYAATRARLAEIRDTAATWGGHVVIAMFPAAAQVCRPSELAYYPQHVDWSAPSFDHERPQRLAAQLARELHVGFIDVRKAFTGPSCGYQPRNMHLTNEGQEKVSAFMLKSIAPAVVALPK
jgi:peptidoglycan/LPS O-acetylase OafA/YrhL